jgi:hypothetical protein
MAVPDQGGVPAFKILDEARMAKPTARGSRRWVFIEQRKGGNSFSAGRY